MRELVFQLGGKGRARALIKYDLRCENGHAFEGWFGSSADYDDQCASGLLSCPECGTDRVEKAIMAPAIRNSQTTMAIAEAIRNEIAERCDDVGDRFAEEARAMHLGDRPPRDIYGQASLEDTKAMLEDGISAIPLPRVLDPKRAKKKLN